MHERDPTARVARAMLALIAACTGKFQEAHALAAPLVDGDPGVTRDIALVAAGTAILAKLGFHVIASTGRASETDYLRGLGAADEGGHRPVIGRWEAVSRC